jgi:hypothetical protein
MHMVQMLDPDEMLRRLKKVKDDEYLERHFYPLIISQLAGYEKTGDGVGIATFLAWEDARRATHPKIDGLIKPYFQAWVEALIDDPKAKSAARQMIKDTFPELYKE